MNDSENTPSNVDEFLKQIETSENARYARENQENEAELDELAQEFDGYRQQVLDALPPQLNDDIQMLRLFASDGNYDMVTFRLTRANNEWRHMYGGQDNTDIVKVLDFICATDGGASAIMSGSKQEALEQVTPLKHLSSANKTAFLEVANKLIDDKADIFDMDTQSAALYNAHKSEEKKADIKRRVKLIRPLLDSEFAPYCNLNDPVYHELCVSLSGTLALGYGSPEVSDLLKSLSITDDLLNDIVSRVNKKLANENS